MAGRPITLVPPTRLAGALRALRTRRGKTVAQMSLALGKHETFWHKYETGERRPGILTLAMMDEVFDLSEGELHDLLASARADLGG